MNSKTPAGIVVGIDGSAHAATAAEWAAQEAERRGCALHLVHAVNTGTMALPPRTGTAVTDLLLREGQVVLAEALGKLGATHPAVRLTGDVVPRDAAEAVLAAAEHAELAVVGTRGHGGFASLLLGSVSLRVAAHCACPVAVVRGEPADPGWPVLVAIGDERDTATLRYACAEASLRGLAVHAVHTWSPAVADVGHMAPMVDELGEAARMHESLLKRTVEPIQEEFPEVLCKPLHLSGPTAATLVEASKHAGLLVVSRHQPAPHWGLRLGTAVHALLHHAHCPVVVVPV